MSEYTTRNEIRIEWNDWDTNHIIIRKNVEALHEYVMPVIPLAEIKKILKMYDKGSKNYDSNKKFGFEFNESRRDVIIFDKNKEKYSLILGIKDLKKAKYMIETEKIKLDSRVR